MFETERYKEIQQQQGLYPLDLAGQEVDDRVKVRVKDYAELAESFGLMR